MGDVLHALPAVIALRRLHPEWQIDWAVDPRWSSLIDPSLINNLHLVPTGEWKQRTLLDGETRREIFVLRRALRKEHYDLCVDLQGTIRSAVVGWLAGARRFAGPAAPREALARMFYGERIAATAAHVVEQSCEILSAAIGETLVPASVTLPVDAAAEAWCDAMLRTMGGKRFVFLAPTAGWGAKQWPAERYGVVAAALQQQGLAALVNAIREDDPVAAQVVAASNDAARAIACTLPQMTALLRRAALFLGGDTGPLHLAAALGVPVVGLYGPTDPERNGPYGASRGHLGGHKVAARVLRHPSSARDHTRRIEPESGLLQISSELVAAAALDLLRAAGATEAKS